MFCFDGIFGLHNRKRKLKSIFSDYILTRDFFVRQFKGLEGYILICRGSFGLYNGKRSVKKKTRLKNTTNILETSCNYYLLPAVPLKLRSTNAASGSNKPYAFTQPYERGLLEILSSLRLRSYKLKTHLSAFTNRRLSEKLPLQVLFVTVFNYSVCTDFNTSFFSCQVFTKNFLISCRNFFEVFPAYTRRLKDIEWC